MLDRRQLSEAVERLQSNKDDSLEIVYRSHEEWPFATRVLADKTPGDPLYISVFDSSYNPPTLAHLTLALLERTVSPTITAPFDAYLLVLSVTNADKKLKKGDASYVQRLEMMMLLAHDMERLRPGIRVAVAIIDQPLIAAKARTLRETYGAGGRADIRPCFPIGWDTVVRFFNPKYYGGREQMKETMESFFHQTAASLICARRLGNFSTSEEEQMTYLNSDEVRPWVEEGKLALVDIGDAATFSSTDVREAVKDNRGRDALSKLCTAAIIQYVTDEHLYVE